MVARLVLPLLVLSNFAHAAAFGRRTLLKGGLFGFFARTSDESPAAALPLDHETELGAREAFRLQARLINHAPTNIYRGGLDLLLSWSRENPAPARPYAGEFEAINALTSECVLSYESDDSSPAELLRRDRLLERIKHSSARAMHEVQEKTDYLHESTRLATGDSSGGWQNHVDQISELTVQMAAERHVPILEMARAIELVKSPDTLPHLLAARGLVLNQRANLYDDQIKQEYLRRLARIAPGQALESYSFHATNGGSAHQIRRRILKDLFGATESEYGPGWDPVRFNFGDRPLRPDRAGQLESSAETLTFALKEMRRARGDLDCMKPSRLTRLYAMLFDELQHDLSVELRELPPRFAALAQRLATGNPPAPEIIKPSSITTTQWIRQIYPLIIHAKLDLETIWPGALQVLESCHGILETATPVPALTHTPVEPLISEAVPTEDLAASLVEDDTKAPHEVSPD